MTDEEKWLPIPGYEGMYCVSSFGNVNNYKRNLTPQLDKYGYYRIGLGGRYHKKMWLVSRLLAIAFIPNPENLPIVCHKDNNPLNNHVSNLEWGTYSSNNQSAWNDNLQPPRTDAYYKLSKADVIYILQTYPVLSYSQLAKQFNVSKYAIYSIIKRKTWKHVDITNERVQNYGR